MPRRIVGECVSCGACAADCPVEAVSEGAEKYQIDESVCIDCGECQENCPIGAIERIPFVFDGKK